MEGKGGCGGRKYPFKNMIVSIPRIQCRGNCLSEVLHNRTSPRRTGGGGREAHRGGINEIYASSIKAKGGRRQPRGEEVNHLLKRNQTREGLKKRADFLEAPERRASVQRVESLGRIQTEFGEGGVCLPALGTEFYRVCDGTQTKKIEQENRNRNADENISQTSREERSRLRKEGSTATGFKSSNKGRLVAKEGGNSWGVFSEVSWRGRTQRDAGLSARGFVLGVGGCWLCFVCGQRARKLPN